MSHFPLDMRCWRCRARGADSGGTDGDCLWPPEGENRVLTVLFPDLCGYMAASGQVEGEDAVRLVNAVLDTYIRAVLDHGGFIARCIHDEVLALFGTPVAREDDPDRALLAALEIRSAIQAMGLNVKLGMNSGIVYFGPVGNARHSELAVVGPAADVAARLAGKGDRAALPGEILAGRAVYEQTRHKFTFGPPRRLHLKGIRDEVVAYELLDHAPAVPGSDIHDGALDSDESRAFLSSLDGQASLPEPVRRRILRVARGRVRHLREFVRVNAAHERPADVASDVPAPEVHAAQPADAIQIPDVFRSSVISELDALEPAVRQLLQVASVIGTACDRRLLALFVPREEAFRRSFDKLVASTLVQRDSGRAGDDRYLFRDAETREVIYGTLLRARRGILHGRIADALEALGERGESMEPEAVFAHRTRAAACAQPVEFACGLQLPPSTFLERKP